MKLIAALFLFISLFGCGGVYNSSTLDEKIYGSELSGSENFQLAQAVILDKCASCHGSWASYTEDDYMSSGLIENGLSQSSELYFRIRGNDTGINGDMPTNGNSLTPDEIIKIKNWIDQLE